MPVRLIDLINSSDKILDVAGVEAPRQNVERMLERILGLSKVDLYLDPKREISDEDAAQLRGLIDRRLNNEPLQYILGETEFYGIRLKCDRRALIPRPETEFVVSKGLNLIKGRKGLNILDLACGSGNISVAMAASNPYQNYYASDLSLDAVALAKVNAELNDVSDRIEFHQGNLFEPFKKKEIIFDMILANPPYIKESELEILHEQVRKYEPQLALTSGQDGLDFIRRMLLEAPDYMKPEGHLISEVAFDQMDTIKDLVESETEFDVDEVIRDYSGIERVIVLKLSG
ncbi:MAG: peptide chain release factor N(5)-glutamine methyltransferase [candidate division Zixibacteria bacterium]|nr:peptide chain release factor N(5)-glutamine methyltransferase [candidate division Zixibacteria bacterium]NIR66057.1 peptide chain release factor N(5)-glutamine methyltransferase [candidate division Zixibacteria bacterium]NIS17141.1 peptide chain release factor N(5)-glutamine methyltransferase [candidate division Zixibacteria bacterium]NIS47687.1 peptide chain release factor N(5)-glutamine methyltransferase [candidate division Zixibacteria bacterium]NIT53496.1 peptide chain release factor N(5